MSGARTKRLNESQNPAINVGIADDFHKLIIPQNTTAKLAQINPQDVGSIAYDTTLQAVVVNTGSGFTPVGSGSSGANTTLSNLTSTSINADLLPATNNGINLGSGALNFLSVNTSQVLALGTSAKTANTHSSATIDNISSTADLLPGMSVNGSGVPHDTIIGTVGANSVTLVNSSSANPVNTLSSLTGTTITFINQIAVRSQDNSTASSAFDTGEGIFRTGNITGAGATGDTGLAILRSGNITSATATGTTGETDLRSGNHSGTGNSGLIVARSGNVTSGISGTSDFRSGTSTTGTTGTVSVRSGNSTAGGTTGDIVLGIGTSSGTRGKIKLQDASTPTTTGFVWTATSSDGSGHWQAAAGASDPVIFNHKLTVDVTSGFSIDASASSYIEITTTTGNITSDPSFPVILGTPGQLLIVRNASALTTDILVFIAGSAFKTNGGNLTLQQNEAAILTMSVDGTYWGVESFTGANSTLSNLAPGAVSINTNLIPNTNGTRSLGQGGNSWGTLYASSWFMGSTASIQDQVLVDPSGQVAVQWGNGTHLLNASNGTTLLDFSNPGTIDLMKSILTNIVVENGATGSRPSTPVVGQMYFDTTLAAGNGKPIWWSPSGGGQWVDAAGIPA